jgi:hypothetical protein
VHVHEEGAARHDLRLTVPARQQLSLRLLRHGAHGTDRRNGRRPHQDTADGRYRSGTGLTAKGKRSGRVVWQDSDSDWLKLKLAHPADCSDAIGPSQRQSRKLRL